MHICTYYGTIKLFWYIWDDPIDILGGTEAVTDEDVPVAGKIVSDDSTDKNEDVTYKISEQPSNGIIFNFLFLYMYV